MVATVQKKKLTEGRKTWVVLIAIYLSIAPALATNYYIDQMIGNDTNDGTLSSPWQSLANINSTTFLPGTVFCFAPAKVGSAPLFHKALAQETILSL